MLRIENENGLDIRKIWLFSVLDFLGIDFFFSIIFNEKDLTPEIEFSWSKVFLC